MSIPKQQPNLRNVGDKADARRNIVTKLKDAYPAMFGDDGHIDVAELEALVKGFADERKEKYAFTWAGKTLSKKIAFTPVCSRLEPDQKASVDFDATGNAIIEGENLEALKILLAPYAGKVKCIYIDPPYNTGHDFVYTDHFADKCETYWEKSGITEGGIKVDSNSESSGRYHSEWLNMMQARLLLARQMLTEDGAIFVSIDDNEIHNLRKLLDEVFGEENFVGCISVVGNPRGRDYGGIARMHDYLVVYGKNETLELNSLYEPDKEFEFKDSISGFDIRELRNRNIAFHSGNRPNLYYPFFINPKKIDSNGFYEISLEKKSGWVELYPKESQGFKTVWRWGRTKSAENLNVNIVGKAMMDGGYQVVEKYREQTRMARSVWHDKDVNTEKGTLLVKSLMGSKVFPFPKPFEMLKRVVEMGTSADSLVLDFFAGSGTTAHAVMELNKDTNGNRKFILVQIPEMTDPESEAYKAGYKKISDITIERVRRAGKLIKKEKSSVDVGFKVFRLKPSLFPENTFAPDPAKSLAENAKVFDAYVQTAKQQLHFDFDPEELLHEVLLKEGFGLHVQVEPAKEFKKNKILRAKDGDLEALVCLDQKLSMDTVDELVRTPNKRFICLRRAVDSTAAWTLNRELGENLAVV